MDEVDGEDVWEEPLQDLDRQGFLESRTDLDDGLHGDGGDQGVETGVEVIRVRLGGMCGLRDGEAGRGVGMPAVFDGGVLYTVPFGYEVDCESAEGEGGHEDEEGPVDEFVGVQVFCVFEVEVQVSEEEAAVIV